MKDEIKPLSWSELSKWEEDKTEWYVAYILGLKGPSNYAMDLGTEYHELLQGEMDWNAFVKKHTPDEVRAAEKAWASFKKSVIGGDAFKNEYEALVSINGVPTKGYWDRHAKDHVGEIKTGSSLWTKERAEGHGQVILYAAQHFELFGVIPQVTLFSLSTITGKTFEHTWKPSLLAIHGIQARVKKAFMDMGKYQSLRI